MSTSSPKLQQNVIFDTRNCAASFFLLTFGEI